jgi:hypothetical protein
MKFILITIIALFSISSLAFAQENNFCKDKESWKEWGALVPKYPHDMDIQMLHAARIGFCQKIEDGTITFEIARDIFNQLHESVYKKSGYPLKAG